MTEPHSRRLPAAVHEDGRSAIGRASDARPFKPYDPARAHREPAAVTAARERHRAVSARIEAAQAALADMTDRVGADGTGLDWLGAQGGDDE